MDEGIATAIEVMVLPPFPPPNVSLRPGNTAAVECHFVAPGGRARVER